MRFCSNSCIVLGILLKTDSYEMVSRYIDICVGVVFFLC